MINKFFVGCRVKLARPQHMKNYGIEGFFAGWEDTPKGTVFPSFSTFPGGIQEFDANCMVVWDRDPDFDSCQHTDQLDVVLPDGAQPSNMSVDELLESVQENILVAG